MQKKVSVIIATRNRRPSLERLMESLRQTRGLDTIAIEIIAVDNGSTDGTAGYLSELASQWPLLRPLSEERAGKNFALNKAIRHAEGEICCFMDDDIVLDSEWLHGVVGDFAEMRYDALQPRVLPGRDPAGQDADERRIYHYNIPVVEYGEQVCDVPGMTGVFMCVKRAVIDRVGNFDERLPASGYHGDTEISRRIRDAGYAIGYTPHVVAYHELNPERYGLKYARLHQYRKGLSRSVYGRDSIVGNVLPNLAVNLLRLAWYRVCPREEKIYRTEKRIVKYWGYIVGRLQRSLGKEPWF